MDFLANLLNLPREPRSQNLFLLDSPIPVTIILISYVILIRVFLHKFMKNREAFDLRYVSLGLNMYYITAACWFTYKCIKIGNLWKNNWNCSPIDNSNPDEASEVYKLILVQ